MKDREYVRYIISHTKADIIFHCAAYKHVPMMEENPVACIENNVFGTKNLLEAALDFGVHRFVLISTDKAVEPVSVYGVSKMLSEKLVNSYAQKAGSDQAFMFVRFGNVLGSRGSILPIFKEQIANGGPVTVTDKDMKRFFMTIPEACSLVLQTGGVGENNASYLLDMGEEVSILELAEQVIKFSGLEPYHDIDIKFIGRRKGERNNEPLWLEKENPQKTKYKKILKLTNIPPEGFNLKSLLKELEDVCFYNKEKRELYRNRGELIRILRKAVKTLDDFYTENNTEDYNSTLSSSVKVVL